ncbi:MAG: family ATPase, partial [Thermoleophilia bacterium]|nr:family ATPase [Thermoleophilia bacterium]
TENPYVSINRALLSRLVTYELDGLHRDDLLTLLRRATEDTERGLSRMAPMEVDDAALEAILERVGGDARGALTLLEAAALLAADRHVTVEQVHEASDRRKVDYDRAGDQHYDHASAYIKSMRASQPDDALRYLAQMLTGGEDPMFIARRLVIFAAEDVGPAKPMALVLATAALQSVQALGMPECGYALAQVTRYCAEAPKSRQAVDDYLGVMAAVAEGGQQDAPLHLTNRHGAKAARAALQRAKEHG